MAGRWNGESQASDLLSWPATTCSKRPGSCEDHSYPYFPWCYYMTRFRLRRNKCRKCYLKRDRHKDKIVHRPALKPMFRFFSHEDMNVIVSSCSSRLHTLDSMVAGRSMHAVTCKTCSNKNVRICILLYHVLRQCCLFATIDRYKFFRLLVASLTLLQTPFMN